MSVSVTIELPDASLSILRTDPESFSRELRLAAAMKWYELGILSQSKAAELAGISRSAFLAAMERFDVSPFQVAPDELEADISRG